MKLNVRCIPKLKIITGTFWNHSLAKIKGKSLTQIGERSHWPSVTILLFISTERGVENPLDFFNLFRGRHTRNIAFSVLNRTWVLFMLYKSEAGFGLVWLVRLFGAGNKTHKIYEPQRYPLGPSKALSYEVFSNIFKFRMFSLHFWGQHEQCLLRFCLLLKRNVYMKRNHDNSHKSILINQY